MSEASFAGAICKSHALNKHISGNLFPPQIGAFTIDIRLSRKARKSQHRLHGSMAPPLRRPHSPQALRLALKIAVDALRERHRLHSLLLFPSSLLSCLVCRAATNGRSRVATYYSSSYRQLLNTAIDAFTPRAS